MRLHDAVALPVALAVVVLVCQIAGAVARRFGQPAVVGEIVGGILLGPTLFDGAITDMLFPVGVRPLLDAFANVGVAVFMFLIGLEFDRGTLRGRAGVMCRLGIGSLLVPFALGSLLALWLSGHHPTSNPIAFVVFLGTAMAVTAFPVLARILAERGLLGTSIGGLALALAALGDIIAWSVLAVVVATVGSGAQPWRLILLVPYAVVMGLVVPRLLRSRALVRLSRPMTTSIVVAGLLASAAATEWIGLHLIFGAFLAGLVVPGTGLRGGLRKHLDGSLSTVAGFLMPIYFVVAGFRVDLSTLDARGLVDLVLILLVAVGAKMTGVYAGARSAHLDHRAAGTLATLMNTRGLTELVLLSVGLGTGIIDDRLYTLMVVMAVATTVLSGPLLRLFADTTSDLVAAESRPGRRRSGG